LEVSETDVKRFFPYPEFRPYQLDTIRFTYNVMKSGRIGLLSAPCGVGKSISVLSAFFTARYAGFGQRLLALTRTRNQLEIYSRELKRIKEHSDLRFTASMFKSKQDMCPLVREGKELKDIAYGDFLRYCRSLKTGAFGQTCEHYERTFQGWKPCWRTLQTVYRITKDGPFLPDEVYTVCVESGLCPYEVTKFLAKQADVIIGNYNYLLVQPIRASILGKAGVRLEKVNCILDEAHSLPRYAAGILSDELSTVSIKRALGEVEQYGVRDYGILSVLKELVEDLGSRAYTRYGKDGALVIKRQNAVNTFLKDLALQGEDELLKLLSDLSDEGEMVRWKRVEGGKTPVSYLSRCASFLTEWVGIGELGYIRYAIAGDKDNGEGVHSRIGVKCLDPSISGNVINSLHAAVVMSGTLWDMGYYTDVLGLNRERVDSIEVPSPFPKKHRLIIVDKAVTTRYPMRGTAEWIKIAAHIEGISEVVKGSAAFYFPSYEVMEAVLKHVKTPYPILVERRDTDVRDVLTFLKSGSKVLVFGVATGKISEGIDMAVRGRSLLTCVAIVGLPYPKKTETQYALLKYFEAKFGGEGFTYANEVPCLTAIAQSAGRLLRSPEDKGVIVLMDGRVTGRLREKLPKEWMDDMVVHTNVEKLLIRIRTFQEQFMNAEKP